MLVCNTQHLSNKWSASCNDGSEKKLTYANMYIINKSKKYYFNPLLFMVAVTIQYSSFTHTDTAKHTEPPTEYGIG